MNSRGSKTLTFVGTRHTCGANTHVQANTPLYIKENNLINIYGNMNKIQYMKFLRSIVQVIDLNLIYKGQGRDLCTRISN